MTTIQNATTQTIAWAENYLRVCNTYTYNETTVFAATMNAANNTLDGVNSHIYASELTRRSGQAVTSNEAANILETIMAENTTIRDDMLNIRRGIIIYDTDNDFYNAYLIP